MFDWIKFLKQAKEMQKDISETLAKIRVEATSGGGMVRVVANGKQEIQKIEFDPEIVSKNNIEMLQDLVLSAVNEAMKKAEKEAQSELKRSLNFPFPDLSILK